MARVRDAVADNATGDDADRGVQNIERAVGLLRILSLRATGGARLTDLAAAAGIAKATAHRLLTALVREKLVEQDESSGLFHLGFDLFALAATAANRFGLVELADPIMTRLAELTADTVYLSIRSGLEVICIDRREGTFPIRTLTLNVGDRRPLGVGAGALALLAFLPDDQIRSILERNAAGLHDYTNFDAATLLELVATTRRLGYAFNDQAIKPGMSGVAVPILGTKGIPIAALSIAAISSRLEKPRRETVVEWLKEAVASVEERLRPMMPALTESTVRRLSSAAASWHT